MKVLTVRNVQQALPYGLRLLGERGVTRPSRNGPVRQPPFPVTTEYFRPLERVCFWPTRDANPFFHLYEALWMLAGRNDLAPLTRYVKDFGKFSDDGVTLYGAYGNRWRRALDVDQLAVIAERLTEDPSDRRNVLQMWQGEYDLGRNSKDIPCNLMATFQRDTHGALDMTVFCRSNDIIWGAYGANAVHFGFLLEYMAAAIGCAVGIYRQVSVNWHAYETTLESVRGIADTAFDNFQLEDPYVQHKVMAVPLFTQMPGERSLEAAERFDNKLAEFLRVVDSGFVLSEPIGPDVEPFFSMAYAVLRAHEYWRTLAAPERYERAYEVLSQADQAVDWVVAAQQWIARRHKTWDERMMRVVEEPA